MAWWYCGGGTAGSWGFRRGTEQHAAAQPSGHLPGLGLLVSFIVQTASLQRGGCACCGTADSPRASERAAAPACVL